MGNNSFLALIMCAVAFLVPIAQVALVKAILTNGIKSRL